MALRIFLATLIITCFQIKELRAINSDSQENEQNKQHLSVPPKLPDLPAAASSPAAQPAEPIRRPSPEEMPGSAAALPGLNLSGDGKPVQPITASASTTVSTEAAAAVGAGTEATTSVILTTSAAVVGAGVPGNDSGSSLLAATVAGASTQTSASASPFLLAAMAAEARASDNGSKTASLATMATGAATEIAISAALTISEAGAAGARTSPSSFVGHARSRMPHRRPPPPQNSIMRRKQVRYHNSVSLTRFPFAEYTQSLSFQGRNLACSRVSTRSSMQKVVKVSGQDGGKTHLLAQGMCMGAIKDCADVTKTWYSSLTTNLRFPGVPAGVVKRMDWVSYGSGAQADDKYYIRRPQTNYRGGHAEPQLISDLEAVFMRNPRGVAKLFIPPSDKMENVYMCGLEIFGPYDMCDAYNRERRNSYNCVGKLREFRIKHQRGQQSISAFLRDVLKDRFMGGQDEDAFVVLYHAQQPYSNIHTYRCGDGGHSYPLNFRSAGCRFSPTSDFDDVFELSQPTVLTVKPDVLYEYIHHLADRKALYQPGFKHFEFNSSFTDRPPNNRGMTFIRDPETGDGRQKASKISRFRTIG